VEAATGPVTLSAVEYCAGHEYRNGVLERVHNDYGYWAGGRYHYYIKDYQGNVRAVIDEEGRLEEVNNYYPYGGLMGAAGSGLQPRKYGGKVLDRENGLDWYDSQARHYDPTTGRTPTMDSKAESYYSLSPYLWCAGNPVRNIDPDGSFVRKNTHYNESYPYVVVFPMNYKNPENGPSLEPDFLAAERIGTPILLVKDAQDFADALDMYPEHGFKGFVINSHGDSGEFLIGETNITTGDEDQMKILKDGLKGKSVFIEACNTGAGNKGKEFTVKFARLTQSTTITSRHNILMGYNYRGGLGLTFASSFEKFLWKLGFNLGNDYRISENGSKARNIYQLSIDINDGFEWEDFGNECIIPLYYDD
jgi:RHS repeat-associated protein